MAKKYNWRAVKIHFSYNTKQAAKVLECSMATIRNWIREGLPVFTDQKPFLIDGPDLRDFARKKTEDLKWSLPDTNAPWNYFPCFTCKDYRRPHQLVVLGYKRAPNAIDLNGKCEDCMGHIRKTITLGQLPQIQTTLDITITKEQGH